MLAVAKLGAVIMPTTLAAGPAELVDRIDRGAARHVVTNAAQTPKFEDVPGDYTRIAIGAEAPGWLPCAAATEVEPAVSPHPGTLSADPLLVYFTSGTTSRPKLVEQTQVSYPVGHLTTTYLIGIRPGDVHLNSSSRRPRRWATCRASRSSPARWGGPCRASPWCWWTR